jgi:hypothetical protein
MGMPLWVWVKAVLPGHILSTASWLGVLLISGRILSAIIEMWILWQYVKQLILSDLHAHTP